MTSHDISDFELFLNKKHLGIFLLVPLAMPHIQFLFVGTGVCSLAYFSAWIAPNHPRKCAGQALRLANASERYLRA
jgi:hypothetical protein